jgi:cytochrome c-type biogenesis protein CcmH/NrfG
MGLSELLLVLFVGGGIAAVLFATLRGAASEAEVEDRGRPAASVSGEQAELEERRQAAIRSLEEIEADHEAGNLSDADYESLRRRYQGEVAMLAQQISVSAAASPSEAGESPAAAPAGRRSWTRAVSWTAGAVAFVALAWLVMSQALRPRAGGGTITGSLPGQEAGNAGGVPVIDVDPQQLAQLERMVAADSSDVEALVELGHLYLVLQRYGELTGVTLKALQQDRDNPEALTHLGMLLFAAQHPEGVMTSFDRALEIDPDFAEALQFKGMVSFMQQDYATAVQAWERYLEVVPTEETSPRVRAMLEAARANVAGGSAR